jgi:hypothetical protein
LPCKADIALDAALHAQATEHIRKLVYLLLFWRWLVFLLLWLGDELGMIACWWVSAKRPRG